jgi:hypothetical protein
MSGPPHWNRCTQCDSPMCCPFACELCRRQVCVRCMALKHACSDKIKRERLDAVDQAESELAALRVVVMNGGTTAFIDKLVGELREARAKGKPPLRPETAFRVPSDALRVFQNGLDGAHGQSSPWPSTSTSPWLTAIRVPPSEALRVFQNGLADARGQSPPLPSTSTSFCVLSGGHTVAFLQDLARRRSTSDDATATGCKQRDIHQ